MDLANKTSEEKQSFLFEDTEYLQKTLDSLNKLRRNKQFCDVILLVGSDPDVHAIHAHRAVLASASPFLLELFSGEPQGGPVHKYKLNGDLDLEAFERLIDYAYTSRLEAPRDKVRDLYMTAKRLRMASAAKPCGMFLVQNLNPENCITVRCIPGIASDRDLVKQVDVYIKENMVPLSFFSKTSAYDVRLTKIPTPQRHNRQYLSLNVYILLITITKDEQAAEYFRQQQQTP